MATLLSSPPENWLLAAARRPFCGYIAPMLPVLSRNTLARVFDHSTGVPPFIKVLRISIIAASAPYLAPREHSWAGYEERAHFIEHFYNDAKNMMQEQMPVMSQLEAIQAAIFLSFCARRHAGIPVSENQYWFHVALSILESLVRNSSSTNMTAQVRRIWWTCYLYERLDAFNSAAFGARPEYKLNATRVSPLTLDDFEMDTCILSWTLNGTGGLRIDHVLQDLLQASMYIKKINLAKQLDEGMRMSTNLKPHMSTKRREVIQDKIFWNAYELQLEFDKWQERTGNNASTIDRQVRSSPSLAVHWASLHFLYCRTVIAFYNTAFAIADQRSSQPRRAMRMLARDRTACHYSHMVEEARSLLDRGQASYAHATDPNIWALLLSATAALKQVEWDNGNYQRQPKTGQEPRARQSRENIVFTYRKHLAQWKSLPEPVSINCPKLFSFPGSPQSEVATTTESANPSFPGDCTSSKLCTLSLEEPNLGPSDDPPSGRSASPSSAIAESFDPWFRIQHIENFIFDPKVTPS